MTDPWASISTPAASAVVSGRRVSPDNKWDFFWARDHTGRCLLLLQHAESSAPPFRLPRPKGIDIELWDAAPGRKSLALRLVESSQRDIFLKLAEDIVAVAENASSESDAITVALARTWRWHHLLKGGTSSKLSDEEQKGLLGELLVLDRHLLTKLSPAAAVSCWTGPFGAPKDFEVGRLAIESKARRGAATPFIKISSEHQLDGSGCDDLFLHVVELDRLPADGEADQAISITRLVARMRAKLESADRIATDAFEACLSAAGLRPEDDYEEDLWIEGRSRLFEVVEGFPRITAQVAGAGIRGVQYSIDLFACARFAVAPTRLELALENISHDQQP